jgi:hypothetical protein
LSSPVRCAQQQEAGVSAVSSGSCMDWSVRTYTPTIASARHQGVRSADRSVPPLPMLSRVYLHIPGQVKPTLSPGRIQGFRRVAPARSPRPRRRPGPAPILPDAGPAA